MAQPMLPGMRPPPMMGRPGGPGGPGGPPGPGMMPQPMMPPPNPALQTLLDSLPSRTLPFTFHTLTPPLNAPAGPNGQPPPVQQILACPAHKNSYCEACGVDYNGVNYLHQFLRNAPAEAVPPPPNVAPPPQRAEAVKNLKEQGNTAYKAGNYGQAIQLYSKSADMALSRPPWEIAALSRDEACVALCNRSAAFAAANAWQVAAKRSVVKLTVGLNALADAEAVVALKRPWTKGHFRKARALVGLDRLEDARETVIDGLQFEPDDKELNAFLKEIDEKIAEADA